MRLRREANPGNVNLPRVRAYRDGNFVWVGLELSDGRSDPVLGIGVEIRWYRPRPFTFDLYFPQPPHWRQWGPAFAWRES